MRKLYYALILIAVLALGLIFMNGKAITANFPQSDLDAYINHWSSYTYPNYTQPTTSELQAFFQDAADNHKYVYSFLIGSIVAYVSSSKELVFDSGYGFHNLDQTTTFDLWVVESGYWDNHYSSGAMGPATSDLYTTGQINPIGTPTPTATPATSPVPSPDLCYDSTIIGSLGTYDPSSATSNKTIVIPLNGAQMGDFVQVSFEHDLQGIMLFGYVSSTGYVTVVFQNLTGSGGINLSPGTLRIHVYRHVKG